MAEHSPSSASQDGSGGSESFDNLVIQVPQPLREDYIQNAVKFLSHPKVKGSPVFHRRSFLEKKGLTNEEIDEAFRRVPDPKPNGTGAAAAGLQQENNHNQSVALQPYTKVQPQAAHIAPHTKAQFSWVNTLLGAGLFLGFGATAAITLKKWFIPSLKSWTRRVVSEGDENEKDELTSKLYEEIREAIKVSASAYSDIARINQEVLASKDEDRKVLMKLTEAFEAQSNEFKSFNETLHHIRANQFSHYNVLEGHVQPAPWHGPIDYQGRAQQTNMYATPPNGNFDPGRHSFLPLPAEPTYGSFSGSYSEQRMQRPGGGGHGFQPQTGNDRSNLSGWGSYQGGSLSHHIGNGIDDPAAVAAEFQRRWVPPQPPGVIMPEAATAIRQPRSVPRQQTQPVDGRLSTNVPGSSEAAVVTTEQMNGAPGAHDGVLASDGGTVATNASSSDAGEEQQQEAA